MELLNIDNKCQCLCHLYFGVWDSSQTQGLCFNLIRPDNSVKNHISAIGAIYIYTIEPFIKAPNKSYECFNKRS